jgi:hypothetical protein
MRYILYVMHAHFIFVVCVRRILTVYGKVDCEYYRVISVNPIIKNY